LGSAKRRRREEHDVTRLALAWVAAAIVVILVVAWWNRPDPPPKGITPEDIEKMSVTERRVLGRCQLQKLWQDVPPRDDPEKYIFEWERRAQQSGHPMEYIWYKDGYWCDKQERHEFWTTPKYD
jgi:hypothetical protein